MASGSWGDPCNNTEECSDHRYVCAADELNISRCLCDRFHEWYNVSIGCIQIVNDSFILDATVTEERNTIVELEQYNKDVFRIQGIAGLFVFGVVVMTSFCVVLYCLYVRHTDKALKQSVRNLQNRKRNEPSSSGQV